jgi:hypothetical protein
MSKLSSIEQLSAELEAAGFRIEAIPSASPKGGLESKSKYYIPPTHRICREDILIAEAAIIPEARLATLHVISESDFAKSLRGIFDRFRSRAYVENNPAKKLLSF